MATITLGGNPVHTAGELPPVGSQAQDFRVTRTDLSDLSLADLKGQRVVLNIYPSVDTGICAMSTRRFNEEAQNLENTTVVCVSRDLPFAHKRFCAAEGLDRVVSCSEYKDDSFSQAFPVRMVDGPMANLHSRAVVVIDETGKVVYTEQVPEIAQEPNYEAALASLK